MSLKIVCFDDNPRHIENLRASFEGRVDAEFLSYVSLTAWPDFKAGEPPPPQAQEIAEFHPDLAIVDLDDRVTRKRDAGLRIIRKLKELPENLPGTKSFPVIAWSRHLSNKDKGNELERRATGFGAIPLYKPWRKKRYIVAQFLRAAGLRE